MRSGGLIVIAYCGSDDDPFVLLIKQSRTHSYVQIINGDYRDVDLETILPNITVDEFNELAVSRPEILKYSHLIPGLAVTTEWLPPKGRPIYNEAIEQCAIREFQEESGLMVDQLGLKIIDGSVDEEYIGSDGFNYSTKYLISSLTVNNENELPTLPSCQGDLEISSRSWLRVSTLDDMCHSGEIHPRRVELIRAAIVKLGR